MTTKERQISLSEARDHFSKIIRDVIESKDSVVIALNGRPVVRWLPILESVAARSSETSPTRQWLLVDGLIREALASQSAKSVKTDVVSEMKAERR
jgi:prevent-host-death family protein